MKKIFLTLIIAISLFIIINCNGTTTVTSNVYYTVTDTTIFYSTPDTIENFTTLDTAHILSASKTIFSSKFDTIVSQKDTIFDTLFVAINSTSIFNEYNQVLTYIDSTLVQELLLSKTIFDTVSSAYGDSIHSDTVYNGIYDSLEQYPITIIIINDTTEKNIPISGIIYDTITTYDTIKIFKF